MTIPTQIPLDFGCEPAFSAEDFLVADCNAEAYDWICRWPEWPSFALALVGPAGCGKSHLAHVFAKQSGAWVVPASKLNVDVVPQMAEASALVVENADRGVNEPALFHLFNLLRETGRWLLLTGIEAPARWPVTLPDLRSRLSSIPVTAIRSADSSLLQAILLKLFADRQLRVNPDILTYILPRMERSFEAARTLVAAIDQAAMALQRPVTIPLVRQVLSDLSPSAD